MNKQKILIVDDDENIAELVSLYLAKECFDTMMVHDGERALHIHPEPCLPVLPEGGSQVSWHLAPEDNKDRQNSTDALQETLCPRHNRNHFRSMEFF